jgi:hypothetical protein
MPTPVVPYQIPDWANPANASVLDSWAQKAIRTLGGLAGVADPVSQVMGLAAAPIDVPAANLAEGLGAQTLKAYHGSPHDFDQFSLGKIGTGEGGQMYGHGLYFAEQEATAKAYRDRLQRLPEWLDKYESDITAMEQRALESNNQKLMDAAQMHRRNWLQEAEKQHGKLYEVNLHASPDELLDWDKPLSQQSPKVQEALKKVGISHVSRPTEAEQQAVFELAKQRGVPPTSLPEYKALEARLDAASKAERDFPSGGDIYQQLVAPIGRAGHTEGIASQKLKDAGIKGIQYLDQGSRGNLQAYEQALSDARRLVEESRAKVGADLNNQALRDELIQRRTELNRIERVGPGTRNFVIFDDKIIEIAKKYGVALPVAAEIFRRQQIGAKNGNVESSVAP